MSDDFEPAAAAGPNRDRPEPRLVSVIIPVRNGADTLDEQFEGLERQTYAGEWELVVADNGSTDGTQALCRRWSDRLPQLSVVDASDRPGSSHARNVGAAHAKGELLAFCDADDVVHDRWIEEIVLAARHDDLVGGVQEEFLLNSADVRRVRAPRTKTGLVRPLGFLPFAPTSNVAMWADVFEALGGLDEDYPQSHDVELSWRAQLAGYTLGFTPKAIVHYRYRETAKGVARQGYLSGLDAARLNRDFRPKGLVVMSPKQRLQQWGRLLLTAPLAVLPRRRLPWIRAVCMAAGRVVGNRRLGEPLI